MAVASSGAWTVGQKRCSETLWDIYQSKLLNQESIRVGPIKPKIFFQT